MVWSWNKIKLLVLRISLCEIKSSKVLGLYFSTLKKLKLQTTVTYEFMSSLLGIIKIITKANELNPFWLTVILWINTIIQKIVSYTIIADSVSIFYEPKHTNSPRNRIYFSSKQQRSYIINPLKQFFERKYFLVQ